MCMYSPNLDGNANITPIISRRLESTYQSNNKIQIKKSVKFINDSWVNNSLTLAVFISQRLEATIM